MITSVYLWLCRWCFTDLSVIQSLWTPGWGRCCEQDWAHIQFKGPENSTFIWIMSSDCKAKMDVATVKSLLALFRAYLLTQLGCAHHYNRGPPDVRGVVTALLWSNHIIWMWRERNNVGVGLKKMWVLIFMKYTLSKPAEWHHWLVMRSADVTFSHCLGSLGSSGTTTERKTKNQVEPTWAGTSGKRLLVKLQDGRGRTLSLVFWKQTWEWLRNPGSLHTRWIMTYHITDCHLGLSLFFCTLTAGFSWAGSWFKPHLGPFCLVFACSPSDNQERSR